KLRKEYVEQTRKNLIGEKLRRNGFEYYIQEISEAVETYARNENIDLEIFRWDILPQAIDILKDLRHAMISYEDRMQEMEEDDEGAGFDEDVEKQDVPTSEQQDFWIRKRSPLQTIIDKETPRLDRSEIEHIIGRYLEEPWRCQAFDRLLIDVLVALEMYAFGDEMLNE